MTRAAGPSGMPGAGGPGSDGLGLTRWRDLLVVAAIATVAVALLLWPGYQRIPQLPLAAGVPASLIGIGEIGFGLGLRRRIQELMRPGPQPRTTLDPSLPARRRLEPLTVARALAVAKATALAGAAVTGIWIGVLAHVLPSASLVEAAASDRTAALIGLGCALLMSGGGLFLERCCRAPRETLRDPV